ncbi:MAG: hypothetical protein E3J75_04920 [Dehalococcoidia bacterium]|nr:MAG: hypothetical protein E3J75_04920 [Dehalococcoidia bacterium]
MKKNSEFENILDECLERLAKGEGVEQCLQSYPEQAAQLEPLLRTAQVVRKASAILPRSEFKARARYEFRSAIQTATKRRLPLFGLRPRRVMAVMIVSILLLAGGGTAAAASNSMPDSPLYPVKLATEQVQLTLTPSDMGKARLCAMLADRRVAEIIYMASKGNAQQVDVVAQRLDKRLALLARLVSVEKLEVPAVESVPGAPTEELAPPAPSEKARGRGGAVVEGNDRAKLRMTVAHYAANHPAALRAGLRGAPESAKPALRRAIDVSETGYERALAALD